MDVPGFDDDELTELYDATVPRMDLVGKAASGIPRFLLAKQDASAGLLDYEFVRALIAKEDGNVTTTRERQVTPNGITLTGSPAQIAAFIHAASVRKEQAGTDVPEEAAVATVTKDLMGAAGDAVELDAGVDGMDPTVPLAAPEEMAPGDPTDPGSPAWESIDAATAQKWLSIAARLKNALCVLAEREMLEAASADPDDIENAWNLEDAMCAVDYAIEQLAVFTACEQAEAELGTEMEAIGKALAGFDTAPLGVIEGLSAVRKAGRVLSSANEAAIRGAVDSLQKVLASLPEAPVAKEGSMPQKTPAADVAKETASPDEQARNAGPVNAGGTTGLGEPRTTGPAASLPADGPQAALPGDVPGRTVVKSLPVLVYDRAGRQCITSPGAIRQPVAKADGDADAEKPKMQAVFDQDGDLIGVVDPDAITPVAGAASPPAGDGDGEMQPGPAAAAADGDMEPQPPAEAGVPAEDVAKGDEGSTVTLGALKGIVADAVTAALGALAPAQDIAKQADVAGALAQVEALAVRIAKVEEQPAMPKVLTNGQVPPAHMLRGQDRPAGGQPVDVAKAMERRRQLYQAPDAAAQNRIAQEMQADAVEQLAAIHRGR